MSNPSLLERVEAATGADRPVRVQLSRKKGWRMPDNTVVVARPTKWGNPCKVEHPRQRGDAVAWFVAHVAPKLDVSELRGKNLACWCPIGEPCHADVLLKLANTEEKPQP